MRQTTLIHVRPHKVVIIQADIVSGKFHARFEALNRSYRYRIINRRAPLALMAEQAWHVPKPLDVGAMQKAAPLLIGKHDFSTFRAQNCQANSPIRTLETLDIRQEGEMIIFETRARSFLYHQVRNMVGTLAMVGSGQWTVDDFKNAFAACDRAKGGPTAPSTGLFFCGAQYPDGL